MFEYWLDTPEREFEPTPEGWCSTSRPKPECHIYSYSNPDSQGALICETKDFPDNYDPEIHEYHAAYSDRIQGWDPERFKRACEIAGGGDQSWSRLIGASDSKLKEFAFVALALPKKPEHVRVVHHYNVSNGYSCPTIEAVIKK